MKKIIYILVISVLLSALFASCDKGFENIVNSEGKLSFQKFEATIQNGENVIESRATSIDISTFKVIVVNKTTGVEFGSWTYKNLPEIVVLPIGSYIVKVYNSELQNAAWDSPYFYGSQDFIITENDVTMVEPIVCKLSNLKVTIKYSDELKSAIGTGEDVKVNVAVGENSSLDYVYNETRAGYFRCDTENKSLVATFSGTVEGYYISEYKVISDVAAGQHRIITFSLKSAPDIFDEYGAVGTTGLSLNASVTTVDMTSNVPAEEETIKPDDYITISESALSYTMKASSKDVAISSSDEWTAISSESWCTLNPAKGAAGESKLTISVTDNTVANERTATVTINMGTISQEISVRQAAYSEQPSVAVPSITSSTINLSASNIVTATSIVDVDVLAPGKIAKFNVTIQMSDGNGGTLDLSQVGLANEFDLCNPGQYKEGLKGLNLPVESEVKGQSSMKFDISGFMPMLVIYSGDHIFDIEVVDELGQSTKATLKLKVE